MKLVKFSPGENYQLRGICHCLRQYTCRQVHAYMGSGENEEKKQHDIVYYFQCSALGATFCYFLSAMVGRGLVKKYFPERLKSWRTQASHHHGDMLWYIIFLRITPFLPNWFINLASPIIGVRLTPFFWGTFFGRSFYCM